MQESMNQIWHVQILLTLKEATLSYIKAEFGPVF